MDDEIEIPSVIYRCIHIYAETTKLLSITDHSRFNGESKPRANKNP